MKLCFHLKRSLSFEVQFAGKPPTTPAHKCSSAFLQTGPKTTNLWHKVNHIKDTKLHNINDDYNAKNYDEYIAEYKLLRTYEYDEYNPKHYASYNAEYKFTVVVFQIKCYLSIVHNVHSVQQSFS